MTVVVDAWAVLALLGGEPAGPRVQAALADGDARMCVVNLGEVLNIAQRRVGRTRARTAVEAVRGQVGLVDVDWPLTSAAAQLKATGGLSYADAFCVATARALGAPLLTGDPEITALAGSIVDVVDLREENV